jgi:hypothetical protein
MQQIENAIDLSIPDGIEQTQGTVKDLAFNTKTLKGCSNIPATIQGYFPLGTFATHYQANTPETGWLMDL